MLVLAFLGVEPAAAQFRLVNSSPVFGEGQRGNLFVHWDGLEPLSAATVQLPPVAGGVTEYQTVPPAVQPFVVAIIGNSSTSVTVPEVGESMLTVNARPPSSRR